MVLLIFLLGSGIWQSKSLPPLPIMLSGQRSDHILKNRRSNAEERIRWEIYQEEREEKEGQETSLSFEEIVQVVLEHEGGYVNDPDDPGGETNFGISKRAFPDIDIKNLTEEDAVKIYHDKYWKPSKVEMLPERLWTTYFDMAVNMGKKRACEVLQKACNHKRKVNIKVDGRLGRNTAASAKGLESERLQSFRVKYYAELINRKPKLEKYWFGWYKRAVAT